MKKIEIESLLKSFILFFLSQAVLVGALFYLDYKKELQSLDEELFNKMRVCSFDLQCKGLKIDFVPKGSYELYKLYKGEKSVDAYFSIASSQKNSLKIYIAKKDYKKKIVQLKHNELENLFMVLVVVALLSFIFSLYALSPFRNALRLTEEFVKDILHDFNTPLSTLRLNTSMLHSEIGDNTKLTRIENSVQNILKLQSNLRSYLNNHSIQKEEIDLKSFLEQRVSLLDTSYKHLHFSLNIPKTQLYVNKDSFGRIVDNLLSNAAKYNKKDGTVSLFFKDNILEIKDTGKGIQNPKKVFQRFYKEQERGIGIGLHIVKKLCDELNIEIRLSSKAGEGSSFFLDLTQLTLH